MDETSISQTEKGSGSGTKIDEYTGQEILEVGATITGKINWTPFRSLPDNNLRNGDLSDMKSVLIRTTIPESFHWVPIQNLSPDYATKAIDGFIMSQLAYFAGHAIDKYTEVQTRKAAIILGTARAISTAFYGLKGEDFIPGACAKPILAAKVNDEGNLYYAAVGTPSDAVKKVLEEKLELNDTEKAVVCQLTKCAAGVIPMQGYSLIMTNHHYLGSADSQARKVYAVAEKAYWKGADVGTWFTDDIGMVQDLMWHKSTYPVSMDLKSLMAMDADIANKLVAVGAGACASRLPATEPELRAANSYIKLFATVAPMFQMFGGKVDQQDFVGLVNAVKNMPKKANVEVDTSGVPDRYVGIVHDRASGLVAVGNLVKQNADSAALCYGFYIASADSSATLGGGISAGQDTLKSSFPLSKLKNQSHASYVAGTELYKDYQVAWNKKRVTVCSTHQSS